MQLLHLSDWHLGRPIGRRERQADHEACVAEQIDIAREHKPDLIVHSGDLFDTFRPSQDVLYHAAEAARELSSIAPTYFISGNHDPVGLFRFLDAFVGDRDRFRFIWKAGVLPPRELPTGEELRLGVMPFFHPNRRLDDLYDEALSDAFFDSSGEMAAYRDVLANFQRIIGSRLNEGYNPRRSIRVFVAHAALDGASITQNSGEREMHLGEMYMAEPSHVPSVDYGGFGHIHKPQRLPGGARGRYAGSPMQLDFGEEGEDKSVILAELLPGRPANEVLLPLTRARRIRRPRLKVDDFEEDARQLAESGRAEILAVTVHTETHQRDLSERVREAYSICATGTEVISVTEDCDELRGTVLSAGSVGSGGEGLGDLFSTFVSEQRNLNAPAASVLEAFTELSADLGLDDSSPNEAEMPSVAADSGNTGIAATEAEGGQS